jgi:hypothetical protein
MLHIAIFILSFGISSTIKDSYINIIGHVATFLIINALLTYLFVDEAKDETDS